MNRKIAAISLSLALLMGGGNVAQAAEQMDNGVWADVYRIGNSRSGRMAVLFAAQNDNGKLAICGNYFMWGSGSVHRRLERGLTGYRVFYNGSLLFTNVSYFWRAPSEDRIGEEVTCRTTDIPYVENANDLLNGRMPYSR